MSITAAILCGGQGTRLQPIVGDTPKCVAMVGGRPFLTYVLDHLDSQGVKKVVLCGRRGQSLIDMCIGGQYRGIEVKYSWEDEPLGTGGALRKALPLFDTDPVLVMNGDTYCKFDLAAMSKAYENAELLITYWGYFRPRGSGVFLATREFVEEFLELPYSVEKNIEWAFNEGAWMSVGPKDPDFIDIGTPEGYARAESFLREQGAIRD